jgi:hypothetical protein
MKGALCQLRRSGLGSSGGLTWPKLPYALLKTTLVSQPICKALLSKSALWKRKLWSILNEGRKRTVGRECAGDPVPRGAKA